jgi:hypothetical protein
VRSQAVGLATLPSAAPTRPLPAVSQVARAERRADSKNAIANYLTSPWMSCRAGTLPASRFSRTVLRYDVRSLSRIGSLSTYSKSYWPRTGGTLDTCVVSWVPWGDGPRGTRCCRPLSTRAVLPGASQAVRWRQHQPHLGLCSRCALTYTRRRAGSYAWRQVGECCSVRLAKAG